MEPERVAVIGGAGFIGGALCRALVRTGRRALCIGRSEMTVAPTGVEVASWRGSDPAEIARLLVGCEAVFHLASASTPGSTAAQPMDEAEANVVPALALLEAMQDRPSTPLVYVSSAGSVYGERAEGAFSEGDPFGPRSYHGAGKVAIEQFIGAYCRQFGASATILRPSNVYGPGQPAHPGFGIVPHAFGAMLAGQALKIWGDGSTARDYLYVDDLVALCLAVLAGEHAPGVHVFNAGSGKAVSLNELFSRMEAVAGRRLERIYDERRPVDATRVAVDASLAGKVFSWTPNVDLDSGLRRTWEWLQSAPR